MRLGNYMGKQTQSRSVYSPKGISPTLCAMDGIKADMPYIEVDGHG